MRIHTVVAPTLLLFTAVAACKPDNAIVVKSVHEVGPIHSDLVHGRDGGASFVRGDEAVWVFGDSFLAEADRDGFTLHSGSYFMTRDKDADDGITIDDEPTDEQGAALPFLPSTDDEQTFNLAHLSDEDDGSCPAERDGTDDKPCGARLATWAGTTVVDNNGTALTFYGLIAAEPGEFNFSGLGQGIARWAKDEARPTRPVVGTGAHPTLLFEAGEPSFGTAAYMLDDFVYVLGCDVVELAAPCKLARVKFDQALDRTAWRYFDGQTFGKDLKRATAVVDGAPIMTLGYIEALKRYVLVYSALLDNDVVAKTAEHIEGPWSDEVVLFTADHGDDGTVYDACWHPELSDDGQTLYVSHTRNREQLFFSDTVLTRINIAAR